MHLLPNKCSTSPDQIGRFFKVLGDKNSNKSRSYDWQLLGNVEKPHSYVNAAVAILFGQLVQTFGLSFTPPPGHHLVTTWSHCPRSTKVRAMPVTDERTNNNLSTHEKDSEICVLCVAISISTLNR